MAKDQRETLDDQDTTLVAENSTENKGHEEPDDVQNDDRTFVKQDCTLVTDNSPVTCSSPLGVAAVTASTCQLDSLNSNKFGKPPDPPSNKYDESPSKSKYIFTALTLPKKDVEKDLKWTFNLDDSAKQQAKSISKWSKRVETRSPSRDKNKSQTMLSNIMETLDTSSQRLLNLMGTSLPNVKQKNLTASSQNKVSGYAESVTDFTCNDDSDEEALHQSIPSPFQDTNPEKPIDTEQNVSQDREIDFKKSVFKGVSNGNVSNKKIWEVNSTGRIQPTHTSHSVPTPTAFSPLSQEHPTSPNDQPIQSKPIEVGQNLDGETDMVNRVLEGVDGNAETCCNEPSSLSNQEGANVNIVESAQKKNAQLPVNSSNILNDATETPKHLLKGGIEKEDMDTSEITYSGCRNSPTSGNTNLNRQADLQNKDSARSGMSLASVTLQPGQTLPFPGPRLQTNNGDDIGVVNLPHKSEWTQLEAIEIDETKNKVKTGSEIREHYDSYKETTEGGAAVQGSDRASQGTHMLQGIPAGATSKEETSLFRPGKAGLKANVDREQNEEKGTGEACRVPFITNVESGEGNSVGSDICAGTSLLQSAHQVNDEVRKSPTLLVSADKARKLDTDQNANDESYVQRITCESYDIPKDNTGLNTCRLEGVCDTAGHGDCVSEDFEGLEKGNDGEYDEVFPRFGRKSPATLDGATFVTQHSSGESSSDEQVFHIPDSAAYPDGYAEPESESPKSGEGVESVTTVSEESSPESDRDLVEGEPDDTPLSPNSKVVRFSGPGFRDSGSRLVRERGGLVGGKELGGAKTMALDMERKTEPLFTRRRRLGRIVEEEKKEEVKVSDNIL